MRRGEGIRLGSYHGAPIILAYSWFLAFALILFIFGPRFSLGRILSEGQGYAIAVLYALMLLFSVFAHELAHAMAAHYFGFTVQRITLNLWGGLTQFTENKASPAKALAISLMGPIVNFLLALTIFSILAVVTPESYIVGEILNIFFWMNIVLGFFNIIPAAPLDGGRIIETAVWKLTGNRAKGMIASGWAGKIIVVLLLVMAVAPLLQGKQIRLAALAVTMVIISTIWVGATQTVQAGRIVRKISALSAKNLARKVFIADPGISIAGLRRLMLEVSYDPSRQVFVVKGAAGKIEAIVDDEAVASISGPQEEFLGLESVLQTIMPAKTIPVTLSGQELLQEVTSAAAQDIRYYILADGRGSPVGVLNKQTVVKAMQP